MSLTIKIFCVATQCLCSDKWSDNSHQIRCTLVSFLSISRFGFDPIGEVKRTAGELSGISMRSVVLLWKVPLVNYFMAASKTQMNKTRGKKRLSDKWTDRRVMLTRIIFSSERRREEEGRKTCVEMTCVCPPSIRLLHLSTSEAVIGAVRPTEKDRAHERTRRWHSYIHTHPHTLLPFSMYPQGLKQERFERSIHYIPY